MTFIQTSPPRFCLLKRGFVPLSLYIYPLVSDRLRHNQPLSVLVNLPALRHDCRIFPSEVFTSRSLLTLWIAFSYLRLLHSDDLFLIVEFDFYSVYSKSLHSCGSRLPFALTPVFPRIRLISMFFHQGFNIMFLSIRFAVLFTKLVSVFSWG